jgi:ribosomal protein S18 acetylase RimI-like enzyme
MLAHRLQENCISYKTKIQTLNETIETFGNEKELFERAFLLETQFPPGIAFTSFINGKPELLIDFEKNKDLTFFGVLEYEVNKASLKIHKEIYGKTTDKINVLIGYAMAVNVGDIPEFKRQNICGYISSVIVHPIYRQKNIATEMLKPILNIFDSKNTSTFLTTWCNTNSRINYSYYPPIKFWIRNGYEPIDIEFANSILDGIKEMHRREGIEGRNYHLVEREMGSLEKILNNNINLPREKKIAILDKYYEPIGYNEERWDGMIMVRKFKF